MHNLLPLCSVLCEIHESTMELHFSLPACPPKVGDAGCSLREEWPCLHREPPGSADGQQVGILCTEWGRGGRCRTSWVEQPNAQLFYTTRADPRRENQPDVTRLETASGLRDWIMSLRGLGAARTRGHWHKRSSIIRTHLFVTHCVPVLCLVHHTQCYISEGPFKFRIYSHCSQTK